jgi:hypothetical protein
MSRLGRYGKRCVAVGGLLFGIKHAKASELGSFGPVGTYDSWGILALAVPLLLAHGRVGCLFGEL